MDDGTYTTHFQSSLGDFGSGIVTVIRNKISGGDSNYRYSGEFSEHGDMVRARICVQHYAGERNSIFGQLNSFTLDVNGVVRNGAGRLAGSVKKFPQAKIVIALKLVEQMAAE